MNTKQKILRFKIDQNEFLTTERKIARSEVNEEIPTLAHLPNVGEGKGYGERGGAARGVG